MCKIDDFFLGTSDAEKGLPCDESKGADYVKGYAYQYELEQQKSQGFN